MEDIMDNRPGGVNYVKDPASVRYPDNAGQPTNPSKINLNWDRIEQLLNIIAQAAQHGPLLGPIVNAAQTELKQHVADAQKATDLAAKAINEQAMAGAKLDPVATDREAQLQRDRDAAATAGNVGAATDTGSVRRI